jgi:hypothetical protein
MGLQKLNPLTVDQVLRGLAVLGRGVVADPEHRPEGPTAQDLPELLGALLAVAEYEVAATVDTTEEPPVLLTELQDGWRSESDDVAVHRAVLVHRLQRTAYDLGVFLGTNELPELEDDEGEEDEDEGLEPPGIAGAAASALAAAELVQAQDHFDAGRAEKAHLALDSVEGALAQAMLTLHLLRMQLRASEEDD